MILKKFTKRISEEIPSSIMITGLCIYQREPDYIKYLYSLRASSPVKFREYFNSFSDYLDMNYGLLS
jgi:hypothetical protein